MSLITPDLTGTNINCKVTNDARMIITDDQVVQFHTSVFADSIEMVLVGTATVPLVRDLDWYVSDSDIDYEAMSAMRLRDKTFTKILVKSITMIKTYVADYKINMSYQRLYPLQSSIALQNYPEKVDFNPQIWYEVLSAVKRHELLLAPISDIHAEGVIKQPMLLEPDPNQERSSNSIVDEVYSVNVPNKVAVIHPIHGAFFKDTLVIKRTDVAEVDSLLKEGSDYIVYGYDSYKTGNTYNPSGVYKFILFLQPFVCDVKISYHAYGGDPSLHDVKALTESINNLSTYILDSQLLTAETVANAPVVVNMLNKISSLEEEVRILSRQGKPNYGDATSGQTLLKKISAVDTDFHWWTIAELYKVTGTNTDEVFVSGTMKLNVETLLTKFHFTSYVSVNLASETDKIKVHCPISLCPLGYVPFEDYNGLENIIRPQFRIIWNENAVENSGIYLQIGMALKTVATETIAIEDISGLESCWKLIPSPDEVVLPEDDLITLPSGNHIWSTENIDSRSESYLIPLVDGNIIWAGTEPLNRPSSGSKEISLDHFLEDHVDISRVRKIRLDLEQIGFINFPVELAVMSGSDDLFGTTTFTYNGKAAYISCRLRRNSSTNKIELSVGADIVAGLSSAELDLRHVIIYT